MKTKVCGKCQKRKLIKYFPICKYRSGNIGVQSYCKKCRYLIHKAWLDKGENRNRMSEKRKQWSKDNAEYEKQKTKDYRAANPEMVKRWKKEWDIKNKDHIRAYAKVQIQNTPKSKIREWQRKTDKKIQERLGDSYVLKTIRLNNKMIPAEVVRAIPGLIELKRNQLKLHRLTKQK